MKMRAAVAFSAAAVLAVSPSVAEVYKPFQSYEGDAFFDAFDFYTGDDPTHGYVDFISRDEAESLGIVNVTASNQVYIGTDHTTYVPDGARGRKSIRLQSKQLFNGNNLIVIDLDHMPTTVGSLPTGCASWPAFWTCGTPGWPEEGEIDIIEYVNTDKVDATTLHTDGGCDQAGEDTSSFTGNWSWGSQGNPADNCDVNAWDQWTNQGCGIIGSAEPTRVGDDFNQLKTGGTYVLEWRVDHYIRAFYFERANIPADLAARRNPDPDSWGKPYARFELGSSGSACPSEHFKDHMIIFDNTFCGDWAGSVFGSVCGGGPGCVEYVQYNPSYFEQSYWMVNFVDIYELMTVEVYKPFQSYEGDTFFDAFDFYTGDDPTHGYVDFISRDEAESLGIVNVTASNQVYIGTDHTTYVPDGARGRKSIRLQSKQLFNGNNLIVIDLDHMPTTVGSLPTGCASWPAFWTCGTPGWPEEGEIDIIEYVNTDKVDATTLHTDGGCDQAGEDTSSFTGNWGWGSQGNPSDNCDVNAWDQWTNQGCGIIGSAEPTRVGDDFNQLKTGGTYVLEWRVDHYIRAFYFERANIPADLAARRNPDPDSWGKPYARFELGSSGSACPSEHFKDHMIIFDNTFCGDWAGSVFGSVCGGGPGCVEYVQYNPSYFEQSYWMVNFVDIYELQLMP